eukprot:CAMPEP_0177371454 /NCGR_PEP_ID=MMETSP0368-20130122/42528_1 /TAXON_ID=447022 ORGANISM="Scrippsiella hangoei-like, Strain SHHI-4" /NCGR_SAMPLE_ID=MMETSP0368 /ASSEMBLY_ACC=CAM_ASM_000363 /LENGTH=112 /DNA_ID=CAMNT_0018834775 /DNA_START=98 /DNA_END=432 /DNA_ORIENTATION=-
MLNALSSVEGTHDPASPVSLTRPTLDSHSNQPKLAAAAATSPIPKRIQDVPVQFWLPEMGHMQKVSAASIQPLGIDRHKRTSSKQPARRPPGPSPVAAGSARASWASAAGAA